MQVLIAVLDDLFRFALQSVFGFVTVTHTQRTFEGLPRPLQPLLPLLPAGRKSVPSFELVSAHGSYFVSQPKTPVRLDPVAAFDNVVTFLTYGTQLTVLKYGGRWAMIQVKEMNGWILKDDISNSAAEVFPQFTVGSVYDAEHQSTKKLRLLMADMFAGGDAGIPLTGAEYVTYRLARTQRRIDWSDKRPRLPGQWQTILRGRTGVHLGVVPKTAAIMEFVHEDEGQLLYVEAVFPDESIQVSAVDYEGLGVYTENVLTKDVWRELRPVFIEVN